MHHNWDIFPANTMAYDTATKLANERVPRKNTHGGGPDKRNPHKKGRIAKYCKWCKAMDGPFTTHNTDKCRRFNKDGSQKDRPTKPFDSAKKSRKKPGTQMAYLTEEIEKLKKKLKKSKKRGKKRARDSSDSDSDSD